MKTYQASILTIGSELLTGKTLDTNARFLAAELNRLGFRVKQKVSVHDDETEMLEAIQRGMKDSDLLLISGGLGPTPDDKTKIVLSRCFNLPLELNLQELKRIRKLLPRQAKTVPEFIEYQATYPMGTPLIQNPQGLAQGLIFEKDGKYCIAIPGVPREAESMFRQHVIPILKKKYPDLKSFQSMLFKTVGQNESFLVKRIGAKLLENPSIQFGIYPAIGEVTLRLQNISLSPAKFASLEKAIRQKIQPWTYSEEEVSLPEALVKHLASKKRTLALAESCTGGWIAKKITDIAGSSRVFKGACVVYSDTSKVELLKVDSRLLKMRGAVSEGVAREMVENVRKRFDAYYGLSVTGISGPGGGSAKKPVGLTFIGISSPKGVQVHQFIFKGDRKGNRLRATQKALQILKDQLFETKTIDS